MASKKTLIQLDTDSRPSVFDSITAIDSDVDFLLPHDSVNCDNVEALVHGAIFTRGGDDLRSTAIFIGGSDVSEGERVLRKIEKSFFGPCRVSVMLDSNGSNTTAAAAVLSAARHIDLSGTKASVLAGTGPVGVRTAELLLRSGAHVNLTSRSVDKAEVVCQILREKKLGTSEIFAAKLASADDLPNALGESEIVFACGGAGVLLWPKSVWNLFPAVRVAVDLNAVQPTGIEAISPTDKSKEIDGITCFGAIGVGGLKMKIHRRCIASLFEANDKVLDVAEVFEIGESLTRDGS